MNAYDEYEHRQSRTGWLCRRRERFSSVAAIWTWASLAGLATRRASVSGPSGQAVGA